MREITIKLNRTFVYSFIGLILGIVSGLSADNFIQLKWTGASVKRGVEQGRPGAQVIPPAQKTEGAAAASLVLQPSDHLRGGQNAELFLIEFSDYECPFCARFHPTIKQLLNDYGGRLGWILRHFPLSFHSHARPAALAAECAGEQGKFWEYSDAVFERAPSGLSSVIFEKIAGELNLSAAQFNQCLQEEKYADKVARDQSSASVAGVTGTPATFVVDKSGKILETVHGAQPYKSVKAAVDRVLK